MNIDGSVGVGIDLVDVARIASMRERYGDSFLKRTFLGDEIAYCMKHADPDPLLAARFAAKEAIVKALGTGFTGDISLQSVGVLRSENGCPLAFLDEAAKRRLAALGGSKILISISHLKDYAQAIAIAVK